MNPENQAATVNYSSLPAFPDAGKSFKCTGYDGCKEEFENQSRLEQHKRVVHQTKVSLKDANGMTHSTSCITKQPR